MGFPLEKFPECMLALILYSGGESNYDLCKSQRNGEYFKWKWFDRCLEDAIEALSIREMFTYPLYSGLQNVRPFFFSLSLSRTVRERSELNFFS